jgi:hypothetical protein
VRPSTWRRRSTARRHDFPDVRRVAQQHLDVVHGAREKVPCAERQCEGSGGQEPDAEVVGETLGQKVSHCIPPAATVGRELCHIPQDGSCPTAPARFIPRRAVEGGPRVQVHVVRRLLGGGGVETLICPKRLFAESPSSFSMYFREPAKRFIAPNTNARAPPARSPTPRKSWKSVARKCPTSSRLPPPWAGSCATSRRMGAVPLPRRGSSPARPWREASVSGSTWCLACFLWFAGCLAGAAKKTGTAFTAFSAAVGFSLLAEPSVNADLLEEDILGGQVVETRHTVGQPGPR